MGECPETDIFSRFFLRPLKIFAPIAFACPFITGCMGIGHRLMKPDVEGYANAITETQKTQLLHAMLMRRYGNLPTFVNVTQIISGHSAQQVAQLSLGGPAPQITFNTGKNSTGFKFNSGISISDTGRRNSKKIRYDGQVNIMGQLGYEFTDKSTVTYQPILGQKYVSNLVRPMPISMVMPLILGGMPIDILFRLSIRWLNEFSNMSGNRGAGAVRFYLLLEDLRKLQEAGALGIIIENHEGAMAKCFLRFVPTSESELAMIQKEIKRILHLDPDAEQAEMIFAARPEKPGQIAILTNSALSMLAQVSYGIEVPKKDIEAGLTGATVDERGVTKRPLIIIRSGNFAPIDPYVAIRFRGRSYWIEDKDFESKQAFNMLKVLCNLATTTEDNYLGHKESKSAAMRLPVTTISKSSGKVSIKAPAGD